MPHAALAEAGRGATVSSPGRCCITWANRAGHCRRVFKQTSADVLRATNNRHRPWQLVSMQGDFRFRNTAKVAATKLVRQGADPGIADYTAMQNSKEPGDFQTFLSAYPKSPMAPLARRKLAKLKAKTKVAAVRRPAKPSGATKVKPVVGLYFNPGDVFRDCAGCPEMVVIPPGSFTMVSWDDAQEIVKRLSQKTKVTYRLITEAEWKYAAGRSTMPVPPWPLTRHPNRVGHREIARRCRTVT